VNDNPIRASGWIMNISQYFLHGLDYWFNSIQFNQVQESGEYVAEVWMRTAWWSWVHRGWGRGWWGVVLEVLTSGNSFTLENTTGVFIVWQRNMVSYCQSLQTPICMPALCWLPPSWLYPGSWTVTPTNRGRSVSPIFFNTALYSRAAEGTHDYSIVPHFAYVPHQHYSLLAQHRSQSS
jgi:hypothetical protein